MIKGVRDVTGDTGVEVLPVVPVVFEGLDKVGSELIGGVRGWVEWIAAKTGKGEIRELAKRGGGGESRMQGEHFDLETNLHGDAWEASWPGCCEKNRECFDATEK
jgi:hypothetical protein